MGSSRIVSSRIFSLFALGMLAACGTTTQFVRTNPSPVEMRARPPETVEVFTAAKPERPFVEVGIVEAQQTNEFSTSDTAAIIQALREEAAARGCDGVIIVANNDAIVGDTFKGYGDTETLKGYRGACIMYKGPAPATGNS